ncbi:MAG: hypothetical protein Q8N51_16240 [Gammaproteobacteria bacterium]|nr:hypothetical protein [Gammaproteobacteria bacterium]
MSMIDGLVRKALSMGHTPQVFRAAAQRNANGFWWWLIIGGAVWYFVSWKWAIPFALLSVWCAWDSVSASTIARRLEQMGITDN